MNKVTKVLLFIVVILLVANFLLSRYSSEKTDMELKIGAKIAGGELSIKEYYTLAQCMESYRGYILSGETKKAYNMLGGSYRRYKTYDDYEMELQANDFSDFTIKDIEAITQTTFEAKAEINGEEHVFLIIIDNDSNTFAIYPDGFINEASPEDIKFSKKKLKCNVVGYKIYDDECIFDIELENTAGNDSLQLSKITLNSTDEDVFNYEEEIVLNSNEKRNVTLNFNTDYDFPESLEFVWCVGNKDARYVLEF